MIATVFVPARDPDLALGLPWPPSVNGYWRAYQSRQIISRKGREYRAAVLSLGLHPAPPGRYAVRVITHAPTRREYDLDNRLKALLDGLTHAGVIADDKLIDDLAITRGDLWPRVGGVEVAIWVIAPAGAVGCADRPARAQ